jgi:hypothetical protein
MDRCVAPLDRDLPQAFDNRPVNLRKGLAAARWAAMDLQEIRRVSS